MNWLLRSAKLHIPVKQCVSFLEDKCFHKTINTLKKFGVDWWDIAVCPRQDDKHSEQKMDAVFFYQDRFELLLDARGYRPEDIKCKMTPNLIEIIGQRQESSVDGKKSMSLARNYQLPQAVKPEDGNCCFSSEGILLVMAPWRR